MAGSYEEHCNDFALYGDPEREHYDHEFNAQFDRFDGWGDIDPATEEWYDDCIDPDAEPPVVPVVEVEPDDWDDVPF